MTTHLIVLPEGWPEQEIAAPRQAADFEELRIPQDQATDAGVSLAVCRKLAAEPCHDPAPALVRIIDLPCEATRQALRDSGCSVERVGSRLFQGEGSLSASVSGLTAREALADLGLHHLNGHDGRREAWRRDGWAGLSALGVAWKDAKEIAGLGTAEKSVDAPGHRIREHDDLVLVLTGVPPSDAPLGDRLRRPCEPRETYAADGNAARPCPAEVDDEDYDQARRQRRAITVKPVLVLTRATDDQTLEHIEAIDLLANRSHGAWLGTILDDTRATIGCEATLQLGLYRARFTARFSPLAKTHSTVDALVSRLLGALLITGRPLRHFSCTFHLPMDLHCIEASTAKADATMPVKVLESIQNRGDKPPQKGCPAVEPHCVPAPRAAVDALAAINQKAAESQGDALALRCQLSRGRLDDPERAERIAESQAVLYFLPELRSRIFSLEGKEGVNPTIRHWRLSSKDLSDLMLEVSDPSQDKRIPVPAEITARVEDVSLFADAADLMVLAIRVGLPDHLAELARGLGSTDPNWWHGLFDPCDDHHKLIAMLQVERWLTLVKSARLVRVAFAQQVLEGKAPSVGLIRKRKNSDPELLAEFKPSDSFSPVVLELMNWLTGLKLEGNSPHLDQIRDDRMVVDVAYGLAGPGPGTDQQGKEGWERLFSLGLYVDRGSDGFAAQGGYAYDREFARQRLDADTNRRWAGIGSLYGYTSYSNCAIGYGDFFCGPVAKVHLPYIYGRMLLLTLFYELNLRHFDRRIAAVSAALHLPHRNRRDFLASLEQVNRIHRDFIAFTNDRWFREVTTQTQGVEVFAHQTRALGVIQTYDLVAAKLARTDAFVEQHRGNDFSARAEGLATIAKRVGYVGLALAITALVIAVLDMADAPFRTIASLPTLPDRLGNPQSWAATSWPLVAAAAFLALLLALLLTWWIGRTKRKDQAP